MMADKSNSPGRKQLRSVWNLGGLSPWLLARNVVREIRSNNFLGRASELAFDFLFALFPLILFMVTIFGLFASRSVELQDDFLSFFADFLPPLAFQLLRAAAGSDGMLTFAIVTALWFQAGRACHPEFSRYA
jgi:membrane protein